jgi:hypothetical protein
MYAFVATHKASRVPLVALASALAGVVPIFPDVTSSAPIVDRQAVVTQAVMLWLDVNNLIRVRNVAFEVFYTNGVKENAHYAYSTLAQSWNVSLDHASQRPYAMTAAVEG